MLRVKAYSPSLRCRKYAWWYLHLTGKNSYFLTISSPLMTQSVELSLSLFPKFLVMEQDKKKVVWLLKWDYFFSFSFIFVPPWLCLLCVGLPGYQDAASRYLVSRQVCSRSRQVSSASSVYCVLSSGVKGNPYVCHYFQDLLGYAKLWLGWEWKWWISFNEVSLGLGKLSTRNATLVPINLDVVVLWMDSTSCIELES